MDSFPSQGILAAVCNQITKIRGSKTSAGVHPGVHGGVPLSRSRLNLPRVLLEVFIRECTAVSPYALLLFGGPITVRHENSQVWVDQWIPLQAAAQTAVLFKELRKALDAQLSRKINDPQLDLVNEGVVPTIVQLLLDEEKS
eukprot:1195935-Prorocentrum_minimum.AAC.1